MIGSTTGQLIFVTLFAYLNDAYGWRGTLLIFAAITANVIVCGAIFRPRKNPLQRRLPYHSEIESGSRNSNGVDEALKEQTRNCDDPDIHVRHKPLGWWFVNLKRFGEASAINICMTNYIFTFYQIANFCKGIGIFPTSLLVNKAVVGGNSKENAAMLIIFIGIGNVISRGGHGWFIDKGFVSPQTLFLMAAIFSAVETLSFALTNIYSILAVLSFLYGFHGGIMTGLMFTIPRLLVPREQVAPAVGLSVFVNAMGNVVGPPLAG